METCPPAVSTDTCIQELHVSETLIFHATCLTTLQKILAARETLHYGQNACEKACRSCCSIFKTQSCSVLFVQQKCCCL